MLVKTQTSASYPRSFRFYMPGVSVCFQVMTTGNSYLILWDGFFPLLGTGSFLLHIHCSVPCWELKIDCGPQSKLSVCAALALFSVPSLLSLPRLSSLSPLRVHWVLPAPRSLCCCLESFCRQFAGEIPGLPSSVVSSPRDHSFVAWCSMSSKPVFYLLFTSSRRVNPFCFSIWGRNRVPICVFFFF